MCEMKFLVEDDVRQLFARLCTGLAAALLAAECASWALCPALCLPLLGLFLLLSAGTLSSAAAYFARRQKRLEEAAAQVRALLDGDATARLDSGREGQLYRLFHEVNEMAAVLNAHADREQREKQFLKNTMADISHQLKTPLAALNIYNGLLQAGTDDAENVRELAELSEQELDRMEQLVQSLLKLTRLDAGTVQLEKTEQDLQGLLEQTARPFACRARQEQKQLAVTAEQGVAVGKNIGIIMAQTQAVLCKIDVTVRILLADHVEMALQDHGGMVLIAGAGRLADDNVVRSILLPAQAALLRKADAVVRDRLRVARAVWDGAQRLKKAQRSRRLKSF